MVLDIWEVEFDERHGVNWNTSVSSLCVSANSASNWPEKGEASHPVNQVLSALWNFQVAIVRPWDALRACHVLTETVSNPWIIPKTLSQELLILELHLTSRHRWQLLFEYRFEFMLCFIILPICLRRITRLSMPITIGVVKLRRHVSSALLLFIKSII